ncbi:MAG: precorrin-6A reductase, partial [Spirochaetaceae bacterium]|nr:precorrin-6A reductase [Spirochaetaceae bacterium]
MKKILVFGGTTEGRQIAEFLAENEIACDVCVATEYGEELLDESRFINVRLGRLSEQAMKELFAKEDYAAVIDATHPFATAVSQNIRQCMAENTVCIPLYRFERKINQTEDAFCTYFASAAECAESLEAAAGTILLTTGSKDLPLFCRSEEVRKRLVVRVLPSEESIRLCHEAGLEGSQIIAMQGPFSQKMNETQIEDFHVSV